MWACISIDVPRNHAHRYIHLDGVFCEWGEADWKGRQLLSGVGVEVRRVTKGSLTRLVPLQ